MGPADQFQVVNLHEVFGHQLAKKPAGASRALPPVVHVLGVGPYQIAEGAFIGYLHVAIYCSYLIQCYDVRTKAAVYAQHLLIDYLHQQRR